MDLFDFCIVSGVVEVVDDPLMNMLEDVFVDECPGTGVIQRFQMP